MTDIPLELPRSWNGSTLSDVVSSALSELIPTAREEHGDAGTFTVVFSGEAENPETAFRTALDDIAVQCADHKGTPVGVALDGLMETDGGVRMWGTVNCVPADGPPWQEPKLSAITIQQEGDDLWTLTIVRA